MCAHSHLQSFATPPPRVAVRRREVIRHADVRGWEKMEKVEFRNFLSITSHKSYCISKIIIFASVPRWLTCDYSPRNNTMSHLSPVVIWWPFSRYICRCLLIGGNSIMMLMKFSYLSQSDRSNWVMWQVKDPCPRPGRDGCLTREKMAFIKSVKTLIILLYIWLHL